MKKLVHILAILAFAANTFAASAGIACAGRISKTTGGYEITYFITDHLGSTRVITGSNGDIVAQYNYYPFGKQWEDPSLMANTNRYTFSGKEKQITGDINYMDFGSRMYDDFLGRWCTHDPQSYHSPWESPYVYCRNNPVIYVDPNGEFPWIPIIIGAAIGAYSGGVIANGGQMNPFKWNYNSHTWGYMLGGAVVGGISGLAGGYIATSGMPFSNTFGIAASSFINSVGTNFYTDGLTPISISFGIISFDMTNGSFGYLGKRGNSFFENLGYGLGALTNINDVMSLPCLSGTTNKIGEGGKVEKIPSKIELVTNNEDWISHSEIAIDGQPVISWGPTETSFSSWEYLTNVNRGTNSYHSYYNAASKTLSHLSVKANANIINAYAKFLNNSNLSYNAIFSSCSTHTSIAFNLAGAFNLGFIHPYLLHFNLMINPYLYSSSHYLLNF